MISCWFIFNTDRLSPTEFEYDCVYDSASTQDQVSETIRYCIRPSYRLDDHPAEIETYDIFSHIYTTMTFEQLHLQRNMTAEKLLTFHGYTSIDIIEGYKIYLETLDPSISQYSMHRCEKTWFGSECQYAFTSNTWIQQTFDSSGNYVPADEIDKLHALALGTTCYTHLTCNRGPPPACLDWREICDGIIHCPNDDGIDEYFCDNLEILKCSENEFRCLNGRQCIPKEFYRDDPFNPDCQDGSDEIVNIYQNECYRDPAFRCEERTCPSNQLACGDGQCVEFFHQCYNNRGGLLWIEFEMYSNKHSVAPCRPISYMCDVHIEDMEGCKRACWDSRNYICNSKLGQICASTIFKQSPSIFRPNHEMYIFYKNSVISTKRSWVIVPHDNCFNDIDCSNTTIYDDDPSFDWCLHQQKNWNLTYIGVYSRRDLTAKLKHLNNLCHNDTGRRSMDDKNLHEPTQIQIASKMNVGVNVDVPIFKFCDGIQHVKNTTIDNMIITDETECEYWPCNNVYTRCDGYANCPEESDELNCTLLRCADHHILCISTKNGRIICLPEYKIENKVIDCIGGHDELDICDKSVHLFHRPFQCADGMSCVRQESVCDGVGHCLENDDENFCISPLLPLIFTLLDCDYSSSALYIYLSASKCFGTLLTPITFFSLMNITPYPLVKNLSKQIRNNHLKQNQQIISQSTRNVSKVKIMTSQNKNIKFNCHRGLEAHSIISSEKGLFQRKCFCPPSYYGNQCQYQNDRVSLTLRFRFSFNQRNIFTFVITLRDESYAINSFVIQGYQPFIECNMKFNHYLLYSTPMKNKTKNYLIHIDIFKQQDLAYYGSWYLPLNHSILPVSRIAALVYLPIEPILSTKNNQCNLKCQHGHCVKYSNVDKYFCRCDTYWHGLLCDIKEHCDCSHDSLCLGFANNRSICICPYNKFGPRCLFSNSCHANVCMNGGTCVAITNIWYAAVSGLKRYRCICTDDFEGSECSEQKSVFSLRFIGIDTRTYSYVIVYMLSNFTIGNHLQNITFQKLYINNNTINIYASSELDINLVFVQFSTTYYLAIVQENYTKPLSTSSIVSSDRRCYHVHDLLNSTIANYHPLRRIKHYPRLCNETKDLVCFYDESLMCICTIDRFSNCFKFNSIRNTTCVYENPCEKNGHCFQDSPTCPSVVQCICSECYYGRRCQFSTVGLGVSLDAILGYEIQPKLSFSQQYSSVKISAILTSVLFVIGIISNIMSLLTFQRRQCRIVGCGIYLLALSITSLLTTIMFMMKFWFLYLIQTRAFTDLNFLHINCLLMEMFTYGCLSITNWLSACVAVERTLSVILAVKFNKTKSKKASIWVIPFVACSIALTYLPDSLHRVLIEDEIEERQWCIIRSSTSIERFNSINLLFHSITPFVINGTSTIILIRGKSRTHSAANQEQSYVQYLLKHLRDLKHLIIAPTILVLFSVPRLILAFLPGCMKSNEDLLIYLASYFISFIPPLLTFPIFVLPFRLYRNEFTNQTKFLFKANSRKQ